MALTLGYVKVVDADDLQRAGGVVRPGTDNGVRLTAEPPAAIAPFQVVRQWDGIDGSVTETWRIEDPNGRTVHEGTPRELFNGTGEVVDEVVDVVVDYADDRYTCVLEIDEVEIARVDFPVTERAPLDPVDEATAAELG